MFLKKVFGIGVVWLAMMMLGHGEVRADIGPPSGSKRIQVKYLLNSPPDIHRFVYLLELRSAMEENRVELFPVQWGKVFSPPQGYRTSVRLVALTLKQADALVVLLEKHPGAGATKGNLAKMSVTAKRAWLRKCTFSNLGSKSFKEEGKGDKKGFPVSAFFRRKGLFKSEGFYTRTTASSFSPIAYFLRTMNVEGVKGTSIVWKEVSLTARDAKGKRLSTLNVASGKLLYQWPWIVLGVLGIAAVFLVIRLRNNAKAQA